MLVSPPIKKVQLLKVPIKPQTILHCINKLVLIKTINFTPMFFVKADEVRFMKAGFEITMRLVHKELKFLIFLDIFPRKYPLKIDL